MSDDEEIICKDNDLYNHLINLGYFEFESFNPTPAVTSKLKLPDIESAQDIKLYNCSKYIPKKCISLSHYTYKQLNILSESKLLFKEDVEGIETAIENCHIHKPKSKWFWYIGTLASFSCSIALSKRGNMAYLPHGITFMLTAYLLKKHFEERNEAGNCLKLVRHINFLQSLCLDVQKLLRFVKEADILSGGKIKPQTALYKAVPVINSQINEQDISCGTHSHLRRCLLESLTDIINILAMACNVLKENRSHILPLSDIIDCSVEKIIINPQIDNDSCFMLKELQALNETYLIQQSEYLHLISLRVCPELLNSSCNLEENSNRIYKFCQVYESKLSNIAFRLKMQYAVNNISPNINRYVHTKPKEVNFNEISRLQVEVHNLFLLIFSMLLRVRNVEEYFENIPGNVLIENQNEIQVNLNKQFNTLKHDLASTFKCFNHISQQFANGIKNCDGNIDRDETTENITFPTSTITTNIHVGASDFNVNSPDEVFLAISGLCSEEKEVDSDDYCFEEKPQIPANLLLELSDRLKVRKQIFDEREKVALDRDGLLDLEKMPSKRRECIKDNKILAAKKLRKSFGKMMVESDSSGNKKNCVRKVHNEQVKQYRPRRRYSDSDSDCSLSNERISNCKSSDMPEISQLSLANIAAMKSQLWRNAKEEYFSDG